MPKISSEKIEHRKREIIAKAFEVFSAKGYAQATMEDIVKHSGISKGGLYTHFKSKEEIFLAIAEERFLLRSELVRQMAGIESAAEKITKYLRWFLDSLRDTELRMGIRFTMEFWSILSRDAGGTDVSKERYAKFEKDLEELLLEGIQKGEFRKDLNTKSAVYIILASLDGIGFTDAVMGIAAGDAVINDYINMILKFLRG